MCDYIIMDINEKIYIQLEYVKNPSTFAGIKDFYYKISK